jgi:hypothetical protein
MRMSHVYQSVMARTLVQSGGRASIESIAKALFGEDRSQIDYYETIVKRMVGRVLSDHQVVRRDGPDYVLDDFATVIDEQNSELQALCAQKLAEYGEQRGAAIWNIARGPLATSAAPCVTKCSRPRSCVANCEGSRCASGRRILAHSVIVAR